MLILGYIAWELLHRRCIRCGVSYGGLVARSFLGEPVVVVGADLGLAYGIRPQIGSLDAVGFELLDVLDGCCLVLLNSR